MTLNHDAHDPFLTSLELLREDLGDLGLVAVQLLAVSVGAVDHDFGSQTLSRQLLLGLSDAFLVVVCSGGATAQDDEAVLVSNGAHDGDDTGFRNGEEMMRVAHGTDGVDGHTQRTICPVLEANGEGQPGRQLPMQLAFGGPGADGADGEEVGEELGGDGVEHLAGERHALGGEVDEELPTKPQALVDEETAINLWVVDQPLPADGGAGLLEVGSHDDDQVVLVLLLHLQQPVAVIERRHGVVNAAGPNNHKQPSVGVGALDDGDAVITPL